MSKNFLHVGSDGLYVEAAGYETTDFINTSAGAGDAGKPVVLDAAGHIDATMINDADVDHGGLGGLSDDDHSQYHNDTRGDARYYTQTQIGSNVNANGASLVGIEDASSYYTGTEIEAALNEIEAQIGGATSTTFNFTEANVLADNDAVYAALEKLDLKFGDLGSVANGEGASLIALEDSAGYTSEVEVEGAIAELYSLIASGGVSYTTDGTGVTKGDLVYVSGNDIVSKYGTQTASQHNIGLAFTTVGASATVQVAANDTVILAPTITGSPSAGDPIFWDNGLTTTLNPSSGNFVWQCGVMKNATDLQVEVRYITKNA